MRQEGERTWPIMRRTLGILPFKLYIQDTFSDFPRRHMTLFMWCSESTTPRLDHCIPLRSLTLRETLTPWLHVGVLYLLLCLTFPRYTAGDFIIHHIIAHLCVICRFFTGCLQYSLDCIRSLFNTFLAHCSPRVISKSLSFGIHHLHHFLFTPWIINHFLLLFTSYHRLHSSPTSSSYLKSHGTFPTTLNQVKQFRCIFL